MRVGRFGVIPSLSMNRILDPSFSVNASTTPSYEGLQDANFGFVKLFPKQNLRLDFDSRVSDSELNNECLLSKDINKKFSILGVIPINLLTSHRQQQQQLTCIFMLFLQQGVV